ncbi:MAG: hypothetical protein U0821_18040 [Chloroflexota bacterium]
MRFDPKLSEDEIRQTLLAEAASTWGPDSVEGLRASIETTAWAIATLSRERLSTSDPEPFGGVR